MVRGHLLAYITSLVWKSGVGQSSSGDQWRIQTAEETDSPHWPLDSVQT